MSAIAWLGWSAVLLVGVPHGAADGEMASRSWGRLWGGAGKILFVGAYLAFAALAYAAWVIAPAAALAALLAIAVYHFGERERGWLRPLRGSLPIVLPALLWPERLEALFVPLIGAMASPAVAAANFAAWLLLPLALLASIWRRGWLPEIASNLLLPPPFGFAVYFLLLHSLPEMRRQARERGTSLLRHLAAFAPFSLAAIAVLSALSLGARTPWPILLLGLLCLAVPHIFMPHVTRLLVPRLKQAARREQ
jgi:Brp/Blh family beta-carotene 15,15'-monooxygenase